MRWPNFEMPGLSTCLHRDGMKKRVKEKKILQARKFVVHQSRSRSLRPTPSLRVSAQARTRPRQCACCGRIVDERMCTSSSRQRLTFDQCARKQSATSCPIPQATKGSRPAKRCLQRHFRIPLSIIIWQVSCGRNGCRGTGWEACTRRSLLGGGVGPSLLGQPRCTTSGRLPWALARGMTHPRVDLGWPQ